MALRCGATLARGSTRFRYYCSSLFFSRLTPDESGVSTDGVHRPVASSRCAHGTFWGKVTMKKICVAVFAFVLFCLGEAIAQTPRHVAVHAGHALDVKSGKMLADQMLVIDDGKIISVSGTSEAKVPSDAVRIELPNATVLPGLIDAHTHLTMDPKFGYDRLAISVPREALIGAKNARATLLAGFTTVRNVAASQFSDVALRDAINAGDVPGPRMLVSGPALSITGGHGDENLLAPEAHATGDGVAD